MPAKPNILDRVRAAVTGGSATAMAVRRESEQQLAIVEARHNDRLAKIYESTATDYYAALSDMLTDRYADGFGPIGGSIGRDGRRAGRNEPIIYTEQEIDFNRVISRNLYATNDYYGGLIDRLRDYTCQTGFAWTCYRAGTQPGSATDALNEELRGPQAILDAFKRRDRWRSRERELCKRGDVEGEAFLRMFRTRQGRPPAVRSIEPEWVYRPNCSADINGPWSFGVLTHPDDVEKHLAYHLRDPNHPGVDGEVVLAHGLYPEEEAEAYEIIEQYSPSLPIGPGRVYHYKCNVDRTIKRGMPTLFASANGFQSAAKLLLRIADTATIQAAFAFIRKHIKGTTSSVSTFAGGFANSGTTLKPGAAGGSNIQARNVPLAAMNGTVVLDTNDAIQYEPGPVSNGIPGFLEGLQAVLRSKGCRVGAPEYLVSGDGSNGTYASTKETGSPFVTACQGRQMDLADYEQDVAEGALMLCGVADVNVAVVPPKVAINSELDNEQIRSTRHQNRVLSAKSWQKEAGLNPETEAANFAEEDQLSPDAGGLFPQPNDKTLGNLLGGRKSLNGNGALKS